MSTLSVDVFKNIFIGYFLLSDQLKIRHTGTTDGNVWTDVRMDVQKTVPHRNPVWCNLSVAYLDIKQLWNNISIHVEPCFCQPDESKSTYTLLAPILVPTNS